MNIGCPLDIVESIPSEAGAMELLTGGKEVEEITLEGSQLYFDFVLSWLGTTYEKLTSPFF